MQTLMLISETFLNESHKSSVKPGGTSTWCLAVSPSYGSQALADLTLSMRGLPTASYLRGGVLSSASVVQQPLPSLCQVVRE